jgi:hypothetical protein
VHRTAQSKDPHLLHSRLHNIVVILSERSEPKDPHFFRSHSHNTFVILSERSEPKDLRLLFLLPASPTK